MDCISSNRGPGLYFLPGPFRPGFYTGSVSIYALSSRSDFLWVLFRTVHSSKLKSDIVALSFGQNGHQCSYKTRIWNKRSSCCTYTQFKIIEWVGPSLYFLKDAINALRLYSRKTVYCLYFCNYPLLSCSLILSHAGGNNFGRIDSFDIVTCLYMHSIWHYFTLYF